MNSLLTKSNFITIALNVVVTLFIILFTKDATKVVSPTNEKPPFVQSIASAASNSSNKVNNQVTNDNLHQITASVTNNLDIQKIEEVNKSSTVSCPMYIMPEFGPVPSLPSKEIMLKASKDQLIYILYQNIKEHQIRIIKNRKSLYETYNSYLKSCK